jgi:hypothetical protein
VVAGVDPDDPAGVLELVDDPDVAVVVAVVGRVVDGVVVVFDESVPVPCSEMAKLSPSMSIVVELVHAPSAVGVNV